MPKRLAAFNTSIRGRYWGWAKTWAFTAFFNKIQDAFMPQMNITQTVSRYSCHAWHTPPVLHGQTRPRYR